MERIVVVGPPGSGKTTVARAISDVMALPYTELDALWWGPNWSEAGQDEFTRRVDPITQKDHWVLDGNYFDAGAPDVIWPRADTMVWLELPRWRTVPRVVRRTFARGITRAELWAGNRESLHLIFRPDSIVRHAVRAHPLYNQRYRELRADPAFTNLAWVRLTTPAEVRRWVSSLQGGATRPQP
jgi:adenylate kinase family enzyme